MDDETVKICRKHALDPQPGDYWHEMFAPVCVVMKVDSGKVIICKKTTIVDKDNWTWDMDTQEELTVAEFDKYLQYSTNSNYWCRVVPGSFKSLVESYFTTKGLKVTIRNDIDKTDGNYRVFRLIVDLPFLKNGNVYFFDDDTGNVYRGEHGKPMEYPLRSPLAGYLYLLLTDKEVYFEEIV